MGKPTQVFEEPSLECARDKCAKFVGALSLERQWPALERRGEIRKDAPKRAAQRSASKVGKGP